MLPHGNVERRKSAIEVPKITRNWAVLNSADARKNSKYNQQSAPVIKLSHRVQRKRIASFIKLNPFSKIELSFIRWTLSL
jgi:hypothetical protein